jgi:prevent-host-death family protein
MTIRDYLLVMKSVRIAELKARLSEYLRAVRRGDTVTVLDRETPIARIVPHPGPRGGMLVRPRRPDAPALGDVALPPPLRVGVDAVALLLEERQGGR